MSTTTIDPTATALRLSDAMAAKTLLLRDAATGRPVTAQQLRAAEAACRDAELDAALAGEVGRFTKAETDRELVEQRATEAAAIAVRKAQAVKRHVDAARALDAAMAIARAAAEALREACRELDAIDLAGHQHNELLRADAGTNGILATTHTSTWPKAPVSGPMPIRLNVDLRPELVSLRHATPDLNGYRDCVEPRTAEAIARGVHKLPVTQGRTAA